MEKWQMRMDRCAGKAECIIGKQRHGPIGTVEMAFEGPFVKFSDLAPQRYGDGTI
jgi:replicative DNA helicase